MADSTDRALPGSTRTLAFTIRTAARFHPMLAAGTLLLVPAGWITGSLGALWLKYFVDAAIGRDAGTVGLVASLLVLTQIAQWLCGGLGSRIQHTFQEKAGLVFEERLIQVSAGMDRIEHLERPEYLDRLDPLRKEAWIVHWTLEALAETVGAFAQTGLTIVLLASVHPALAVLPLFGVPALLFARAGAVRERRAEEQTGESRRLQRHLVALGSKASPGKELRVFDLGDHVRRLSRHAWRQEHAIRMRATWTGAARSVAAAITMAVGFTSAVALVGYGIVSGTATVGDLALVVVLTQTMSGNLGMVVEMLRWLVGCLGYGARLLWLQERAEEERGATATPTRRVPARLVDGIELRDLTFRYPGTERVVFDRLSLRLPAGSVTAVVGENGAGKTTLVKLLCGLYAPTHGAVVVDGVDLEDLDLPRWRQRCAGAFQDHARLELPLREAVTAGDLSRFDHADAATRALAAAGAGDLLRTLPAGLDTQLGATWPGGVELSGGQWQQVALARGLLRRHPLLTVLDEPTSALDAQTEDALFTRYAAAARERRDLGAVTLLVSHRFSTVRAADQIVVLHEGRVIEHGGHEQLLRRQGRYAELYEIQARGYR